jgi:hypothetical protein
MSEAQKAGESSAPLQASDVFDEAYYRSKYADIGEDDAFGHFMAIGGWEGRKCSDRFDAGWYLVNYDDVATGGIHPLDHYLGIGFREKRKTGLTDRHIALLHDLVGQFSESEPAIRHEGQFKFLDRIFYARGAESTRVRECWKKIFASLAKPYDRIVFSGEMNEADAAVYVMEAAAETGKIAGTLLVQTDFVETDTARVQSAGADVLIFSDFDSGLTHDERVELVEYLIAAVEPEAVLNVDSAACWGAFRRRSAALSQFANLFACVLDETGLDEAMHASLPHLRKVYTADAAFIEQFAERHRLSDRKRLEFIGGPETKSPKRAWPRMKAAFTAASGFLSSKASLQS